MIIDYDVCGRICIWRRGKRTSVSIRPQRGPVGFSRIYSSSFSSPAISSNWCDFRKNKTSVLNEALDFVKMWCEGIEERFSNNRVIVRPLSWLVCIGPFQPPNKGGTPTTEIQEILSPLSVFSPNKEGTPTTEIRKSFLHFQLFQQTREGLHLLRSGNPFSEPAKPTLEKCFRNQNDGYLSPSGILGLRINSKVEIYWTRGLKWEVSGGQPHCSMRLEICLDEA